jgi:1-deoxy-D-xylulose-5-phosphate synthase
VRDYLAECGITTPVVRIGWPDQFIEHASSVAYLRDKHGLTGANTADLIRQALGQAADAKTSPNKRLAKRPAGSPQR